MTTEELIEKLKQYPGMKVYVSDDLHDDLSPDPSVDIAINHPGAYLRRRNWHWVTETEISQEGEEVLVIYG